MNELSLFDFLPEEEAAKFKPQKSTDWKWSFKDRSIANASTFPQDYDFCGERVAYICGMSVPPVMIKRIVQRLIESGVL